VPYNFLQPTVDIRADVITYPAGITLYHILYNIGIHCILIHAAILQHKRFSPLEFNVQTVLNNETGRIHKQINTA
jgi:hypothetical protein